MNDEDKKLAPETPADTLHSHAMNHIALPEDQKFDNEPLMDEVTEHPNLNADTISKLYAHATEHVTGDRGEMDGHTEAGNMSNDQLGNLLNHPNAPADIKKHFALNSWHPDNPNSSLHEELSDSGILNNAELQSMSEKALAAGEQPHPYQHISPDYFMNKFKARSQQDPESLDEEEKKKWSNEVKLGERGLNKSKGQTPATLDQTIDAFAQSKHGPRTPMGMLESLVKDRRRSF